MAELKSEHQLLHTKAFGIIFFVILLMCCGAILVWQSIELERKIDQNYLPALAKQHTQDQLISQSRQLSQQIISLPTKNNIEAQLAALQKLLAQSKSVANVSRSYYPMLTDNELTALVVRISNNEKRNSELTIQATSLIRQVEHSMIDLIALMKDRQANLYEQVLADRVSDRVTTSRAIAHANLTHEIQAYQEAYRHLQSIDLLFEEITYLSAVDEIDAIEQHAEKFQQWQGIYQDQLKAENDALIVQLEALTKTLFGDVRLVSKWRGQLRLTSQYILKVEQQIKQLDNLKKINQQVINRPQFSLINLVDNFGVKATQQQIKYALLALVLLSFIAIIVLLLKGISKIRRTANHTVELVNELSAKQPSIEQKTVSIETIEQQKISQQLLEIVLPEHDETAYQQLKERFEFHKQLLLSHQNIFIFSGKISDLTVEEINCLNALCKQQLAPTKVNSWRQFFSREQCADIIVQLRKLKSNETSELTLTFTEQGSITLYFEKKPYFSVLLCDNSHLNKALVNLAEQNRNSYKEQQGLWQVEQEVFRHIKQQLIASSVLTQANQGHNRSGINFSRQLMKSINWSEGGFLWAKNHLDDHSAEFTDVALSQVLMAIVLNAQQQHTNQTKTIHFEHLTQEQQILSSASIAIDLPVFQFVLTNLFDIQLVNKNCHLNLSTKVVDHNAAQMVVNYQFNYQQEEALAQLPAAMLLLSHQVESQPKTLTFNRAYFVRALLDSLHVNTIELVQQSHGWQFSFNLPHATPVSVEEIKTKVSLPALNTRVVVISQDEQLSKWLNGLLKPVAIEVVCVTSLSHAQNLFDIERVEKNKIGLIITSIEENHHELHHIETLIHQLPSRLQPKLFTFSPINQLPLSQYDLFSASPNVKLGLALVLELKALLDSEQSTNLISHHRQLQQQQIEKTITKVLIASSNAYQAQAITRLLQWLGFDVTILCQAQQAQSAWQSGLYRILISEFPFEQYATFQCKKPLKRLVVSFSKLSGVKSEYIDYKEATNNAEAKQWLDILAQWLVIEEPDDKQQREKTNIAIRPAVKAESIQNVELAFDLTVFSHNIGGPALAALLIDDYLLQANELVTKLHYALSVKSQEACSTQINRLKNISQMIASAELEAWSVQLAHCVEQFAFQEAQHLLPEIIEDVKALQRYADAI